MYFLIYSLPQSYAVGNTTTIILEIKGGKSFEYFGTYLLPQSQKMVWRFRPSQVAELSPDFYIVSQKSVVCLTPCQEL